MKVRFRKLTDERHELSVSRDDGAWVSVECETRSYLVHDFLHLAVESEARLESGFWGRLAAGATLAEMNDRARPMGDDMAAIERLVGALTSSVKGATAEDVVAAIQRYARSTDVRLPAWLDEPFVLAVQARMRKLIGAWKATQRGEALEIDWPTSTPA